MSNIETIDMSSLIQTVTVGFGITPNRPRLRLVGYTTGGDLHPALKTIYLCIVYMGFGRL